ncbi:MAG: hypothetical protein KJ876_01385, partial [Alphaproteobacteria bacterium]|nr:hypothetical protein [Alphaproteobacteria bacterium]
KPQGEGWSHDLGARLKAGADEAGAPGGGQVEQQRERQCDQRMDDAAVVGDMGQQPVYAR